MIQSLKQIHIKHYFADMEATDTEDMGEVLVGMAEATVATEATEATEAGAEGGTEVGVAMEAEDTEVEDLATVMGDGSKNHWIIQ